MKTSKHLREEIAALGAQTLLATLTFNAAAFPGASNGVLTAAAITSDSSIDATSPVSSSIR